MNAAVLTISDGVHHGTREDKSGDTLAELLEADGFAVERRIVPDERDEIAAAIADLADRSSVVLTTGGTGFSPRDVTPEATQDGARSGGAGHLRGDPRRRAHPDTARDALSRPRRPPRSDADREHARLARRLPRRLRGAAAGARARARAGGRRPGLDRTSRHERDRTLAAAPLRLARQVRAHRLRAALRLRRRVPRRRRLPGHRQPRLAHARDDRRPHAGDGAQPAHRRRARRPQPAHRHRARSRPAF